MDSVSNKLIVNTNISNVLVEGAENKTIACVGYDQETKISIFATQDGNKLYVDDEYVLLAIEENDPNAVEEFNSADKEEAPWYEKLWCGVKGVFTDGIGGLVKTFIEHPVIATVTTAGAVGALYGISCIPYAGPIIAGGILVGLGIFGICKAIGSGVENIKEANEAEKHGNYIRAEQEYKEIGGDVFDLGLSVVGTVSGANTIKGGIEAAKVATLVDDAVNVFDDAANVADDVVNVVDDAANVADDAANVADDAVNVVDDAANVADDVVKFKSSLDEQLLSEKIDKNEYAKQLVEFYKSKGLHSKSLEGWAQEGEQLIKHYQVKNLSEDPTRASELTKRVASLNNPEIKFNADTMDDFSQSTKDLLQHIQNNATSSCATPNAAGAENILISNAGSSSGFSATKTVTDSLGRQITYSWIGTPSPSQNTALINGLPGVKTKGIVIVSSESGISTITPRTFEYFLLKMKPSR